MKEYIIAIIVLIILILYELIQLRHNTKNFLLTLTSTSIDFDNDTLKSNNSSIDTNWNEVSLQVGLLTPENQSISIFQPKQYNLTTYTTKYPTNMPTSKPKNVNCPYNFSVYIYDIPDSLLSVKLAREARINQTLHICKKCILEQFALEYIIHDFFTQFCGRTYSPYDADYFYLPIIRDAEYRIALQEHNKNSRASSNTELALLDIIEKNNSIKWKDTFNITDYFWFRNNGADHIIVMPAPVTNLRHESSQRGYFHYMIHLNSPIFLLVEYTIGFINEYPICSTKKNIIVPYPTLDPDLFNGKYFNKNFQRYALLYYAGGMHGDCIEVRKAISQVMKEGFKLNNSVVPKIKSSLHEREHGFLSSIFCPIPIGDSPSSKRMYDVINFGCIPVILSDELIWAFSIPVNGPLNHSSFSIHIPQCVVQFPIDKLLLKYKNNKYTFGILPSGVLLYDLMELSSKLDSNYENDVYVNTLIRILRRIPKEDISLLQKNIDIISPYYRYYNLDSNIQEIPTSYSLFPSGGSISLLSEALYSRKIYGIKKLYNDCLNEKNRKDHKYISKYHCDKEIRRRRLENTMYTTTCSLSDI